MRYCLRCRRLSGEGPVCTSCGGSFGGRLCDHPRGPHINPPDARFCARCGSPNLRESAGSIRISWIGWLFKAGLLLALLWLVAPPLLSWIPGALGNFLGISHYRDWRVWAFETLVPLFLPGLVFLAFVNWITGVLFPGRSGRQVRSLLSRFLSRCINLFFDVLGGMVKVVTKMILNLLDRNRGGPNRTGL